jgi:hypothetical protein
MWSECIDPYFLDLETSWRWVVSFKPQPFYLEGNTSGIYWIRVWVGPRAGLDDVEKRKFMTLTHSSSDLSVVHPVASRYTNCAIPAPLLRCKCNYNSSPPYVKYRKSVILYAHYSPWKSFSLPSFAVLHHLKETRWTYGKRQLRARKWMAFQRKKTNK